MHNSGKIMFSLVIAADFNQAAECLPENARGRQCVLNCVMFLITSKYLKPPVHMQKEDLHDIMFAGSYLYNALHASHPSSGLVDPLNIPERIQYKGKTIHVSQKAVLTSFMGSSCHIDEENIFSLDRALTSACCSSCPFILTFGGLSVGVHSYGTSFYIFDSHSRNASGMCCPAGSCILGQVQSLQQLCNILCSLSFSAGKKHLDSLQFDLHSFSFTTRHTYTPCIIHILDERQGYKIKHCKVVKGTLGHMENNSDKRSQVKDLMCGKSYGYVIDSTLSAMDDDDTCIAEKLIDGQASYACFKRLVSHGPDYVCSCCTQTIFRHSVRNVSNIGIRGSDFLKKYPGKYKSVESQEWICQTCLAAIKLHKTPKLCLNNGIKFPVRPAEWELSYLEESLVSPRLPFMQLQQLPRGGQINVKGNVVNVLADVNGTIKSLPRIINDSETIMLKLKRKLSYKHHIAFENVRPNKVFAAAQGLLLYSSLFRNEGIVVNETWLEKNRTTASCPFEENASSQSDCNEKK